MHAKKAKLWKYKIYEFKSLESREAKAKDSGWTYLLLDNASKKNMDCCECLKFVLCANCIAGKIRKATVQHAKRREYNVDVRSTVEEPRGEALSVKIN